MSNRETIIYEAEEVAAGRMSVEQCEYPEEVLNELNYPDVDSEGYIIPHNINWNNYDYIPQENNNQNNHEKTCCGICCLLFLIFWFFSVITYHPNI